MTLKTLGFRDDTRGEKRKALLTHKSLNKTPSINNSKYDDDDAKKRISSGDSNV